ncbi:MAG: purine-nucleoside phosphorylase [Kiritimatiellae bacterium]|nr:purine-nucleoside phosphorylase [Kiritimatiellia bacterium]MDW8458578.1 purine-nucleoside phosphorylase [Verrucomicrobiota bacterium]
MIDRKTLDRALEHVRREWPDAQPEMGLILGSGWSDVAEAFHKVAAIPYDEIPGLGRTGVAGHAGQLVLAELAGLETLIFQGRRHFYEGVGWTPIALPIFLLRSMRAKGVLLTNAAGGIRSDLKPGTLMIIEDHINFLGANPLAGPHDSFWGPRFPDQTQVYDVGFQRLLKLAGRDAGEELATGVYLANSGPSYETPAEIRAFRALGADAVGMSTVPEALLASACGLRVAGLSCITNSAAGITAGRLSHEEVTEATRNSMKRMKQVVLNFWNEVAREGLDPQGRPH